MDFLDFTGTPRYMPRVLLGALALGAGARFGKNLLNTATSPKGERVRIKSLRPAISDVTIPVSEEEAEELRDRGIRVKEVLRKAAQRVDYDPNPLLGVGYGILGAGGLVGGWRLADYLVDKARKSQAENQLKDVRKRIERILEDQHAVGPDQVVLESIKAAEDAHVKTADVGTVLTGLGMLTGASAILQALASFKGARRRSVPSAKVRAINQVLQRRQAMTPSASLSPVVYIRDRLQTNRPVLSKLRHEKPVKRLELSRDHGAPSDVAKKQKEDEEEKKPVVAVPAPVLSGSWI